MTRSKAWLIPAALVLVLVIAVAVGVSSGFGLAGGPAQDRALQLLAGAQWEYHSTDADGDGYLEFAPDVSSLGTGMQPPAGYSWKVYPVPGEKFAPDGGLLSGFIIASEPRDSSGPVYLIDHTGATFQVPSSLLTEWLQDYPPAGASGGD